jgi:hypothetical protein
MPGYDGTGPRGLGPMTGQGSGYCLLKLPSSRGEPLSGFAGRSGVSVRLRADGIGMDLVSLRFWVQRLEAELHDIRRRIVALGRK